MDSVRELQHTFQGIDVYLFDQLQKGRFIPGSCILDAGCGSGRNTAWMAVHGFDVHGIDANPDAIDTIHRKHPQIEAICCSIEDMPFPAETFDVVLAIAVLHFAENREQFCEQLDKLWSVLKPDGFLFCRLASSIGIEMRIKSLGNDWYKLPDGSERFLVDEAFLIAQVQRLSAKFCEPLKTVNVHNQRCMSTLVLQKQ